VNAHITISGHHLATWWALRGWGSGIRGEEVRRHMPACAPLPYKWGCPSIRPTCWHSLWCQCLAADRAPVCLGKCGRKKQLLSCEITFFP
jgi:hypothetical protein